MGSQDQQTVRRRGTKGSQSGAGTSAATANADGRALQDRSEPPAVSRERRIAIKKVFGVYVFLGAIIVTGLADLAPKLLEPVYGTVFSSAGFVSTARLLMMLLPALQLLQERSRARVLASDDAELPAAPPLDDVHASDATYDVLALVGVMIVAAPTVAARLAPASAHFGPGTGPHITFLAMAYPAYVALGWTARTFARAIAREQHLLLFSVIMFLWSTGIVTKVALPFRATCKALDVLGVVTCAIVVIFRVTLLQAEESETPARARAFPRTALRSFAVQRVVLCLVVAIALYKHDESRNPHCAYDSIPDSLQAAYAPLGFKVLARNESVTGWVSVIDEPGNRHIRVLRAGHSIIGGIYTDTGDSVYGSFYLPEAARLIDREYTSPPRTLIIGLGIGISVPAFLRGGGRVDAVEIDPVVPEFATKYFGMPTPTRLFIQDGRKFLDQANPGTYDFIVHDVFTGGAVPPKLFSQQALERILVLLKHDGVLAMNFVGSTVPEYAKGFISVLLTLRSVFTFVTCLHEATPNNHTLENFVFLASNMPYRFRDPTAADFMGSAMRKKMLTGVANQRNVVDLNWFEREIQPVAERTPPRPRVVTDRNGALDGSLAQIARLHWSVMRDVFPLEFWTNV